MDTTTALSTLKSYTSNLAGSISGVQAQQSAIEVAILQLQGLLDTPSEDLVTAQNALTAEQAAHASDNTKNAESIATLTSQLADSQASVVTEQTNHTNDNVMNTATIADLQDQLAKEQAAHADDNAAKDAQIVYLQQPQGPVAAESAIESDSVQAATS